MGKLILPEEKNAITLNFWQLVKYFIVSCTNNGYIELLLVNLFLYSLAQFITA